MTAQLAGLALWHRQTRARLFSIACSLQGKQADAIFIVGGTSTLMQCQMKRRGSAINQFELVLPPHPPHVESHRGSFGRSPDPSQSTQSLCQHKSGCSGYRCFGRQPQSDWPGIGLELPQLSPSPLTASTHACSHFLSSFTVHSALATRSLRLRLPPFLIRLTVVRYIGGRAGSGRRRIA